MKHRSLALTLAMLAAAATPAYAMQGCDMLDGSHESIAFALVALNARERGQTRQDALAQAAPVKTDPAWHAAMARETVDEVFSDLAPVDGPIYTVYRAMICYHASQRPTETVVVDYPAVHPLLVACESLPDPWEKGRCGGEALDTYFKKTGR